MTSTTSPLKINGLVVRSGMAIIDSRDNFHAEKESDIKTESIIDPAQIKFYEAFQAQIEAAVAAGKKTIPAMFRCQMYVPDADGNITLKEVSFTMLGQKSITTLGNLMEKLKAPGAKKARPGAGEGGGEGASTGEQNAAGEGATAAGGDTTVTAPVVDDAAVKAAAEAEAAAKAKAEADAKAKADAEAKKAAEAQAAAAAKAAADEAAKAKAAQDAAVAATAEALPVAAAAEAAVAETAAVAIADDAAVVDSLFAED